MRFAPKILLLCVLGAAVFMFARTAGWYTSRQPIVETQLAMRDQIEALDGYYYYDFQLIDVGQVNERIADRDDPTLARHWLSDWLGLDWFHDITYVTFAQFDGVPEDGGRPTPRSEIGDEQIAELIQLPGLRWLALNGTSVTDAGIALVTQALPMHRMWLGQTQLSDQGLKSLGTCRTLQHLSIEATPTSDLGLAFLTQLPDLRFLSLGSPFVTQSGLRGLAQIQSLQTLYVDGCPVDAAALNALGKLSRLRELSLRSTLTDDLGLAGLAGLGQLQTIRLDGTPITDRGLRVFKNWPDLRVASLAKTQVTDTGLMCLASCRELESLELSQTNCTLTGVLELLVEQQGHTLEEALEIAFDCKFDPQGELISLDLEPLIIRDEDLGSLAPLRELQWLMLPNNRLTDQGVERLVEAGFPRLSLLKIDGAQISETGLQRLVGLESLKDLHINATGISEAVVDRLKQQKPALSIYRRQFR